MRLAKGDGDIPAEAMRVVVNRNVNNKETTIINIVNSIQYNLNIINEPFFLVCKTLFFKRIMFYLSLREDE